MAEERATIGGAVRYAFALLAGKWRLIWGALALSALANTVFEAGWVKQSPGLIGAGLGAVLITNVMVYGAVYRLALADRRPRDPDFVPAPVGVGWRATEWRLLGASLLCALFVGFVTLLVGLVVSGVAAGVLMAMKVPLKGVSTPQQLQATLGTQGQAVVQLCGAALLALVIFLSTRLSLSAPATADEGAVRVLRTWKLTRGRFWVILAAGVIAVLPIALTCSFIASAVMAATGDTGAASPEQILGAALIVGVPAGFLTTPLSVAVLAYFYRAAAGPVVRSPITPPQ